MFSVCDHWHFRAVYYRSKAKPILTNAPCKTRSQQVFVLPKTVGINFLLPIIQELEKEEINISQPPLEAWF